MPTQSTYSPDFQQFLDLVDKSLILAAKDARELAERTGTPLVVRECAVNQAGADAGGKTKPTQASDNSQ